MAFMKKMIFTNMVSMMICAIGFAADVEYEAGTNRARAIAKNGAVKTVVSALSQQPSLECFMETLGHPPVSALQVLVGFYVENSVSKFVVGVNCIGSEEMGDQRYEINGIRGDGGILIESVVLQK
jgi:hypothetical protein